MTYIKPGVYSQFKQGAGTVILGAGARILAIVGSSYTYKIAEEIITRGGAYPYSANSSDTLSHEPSEVLSVGDRAWSSDYTEGVDFNIIDDTIDWSLGGDEPTVGNKYYIRYKYLKTTTDYNPKLFYTQVDAQDEYGYPYSNNPLSLALQVYFENGPAPVIAVQTDGTNVAAIKVAIDKLKYQVEGVDPTHIIALSTDDEIHSYLLTHVDFMSSEFQRKERRAIISTPINTLEAVMKAKASALASERMIYTPQWAVRSVPNATTLAYSDYTLDGTYLACAVTGKLLSRRIEESLININVSGFKELSKQYLEDEADALAEKGILLVESVGGLIKVRHDITTSTATPEENQWSIGEIKDFLIKNLRSVLDKQWKGKPIYGTETIDNVKTTVAATLDKMIENRVITQAGNIVVKQNNTDPRELDVSFDFLPVYPIVWIYITFGYSGS